MWVSFVGDALREFRYLLGPSPATCPWGFLVLAIWLACGCGCCIGICIGIFAASRACRALAVDLVRVLLSGLGPHTPVLEQGALALRRRFQGYRA